jgi:hypothetical protein
MSEQPRLKRHYQTHVTELMNRWIASDKSTRIPISTFQLALQLHGVAVDVEEVECMLANMVYRVSPLTSPAPLSLPCSNILSRRGASRGVEGEQDEEQEG